MTNRKQVLEQMAEDIAKFTVNPLGFVKYAYPWAEIPDLMGKATSEPRVWQRGILEHIGNHLQNPATRFQPCRIAVASGNGVGKSALIAQVTHWALSTCDDAKVVVTANTEPQLRTKTWPEMNKWFRYAINREWFEVQETCIFVKVAGHERTWRADRITWSEHNTEAFAGLHNKGKRIVLLFDEASAIHDEVWKVAEGALTDEGTEIIWLVFGNPTQSTGRFRECFGRQKDWWKTLQLDSRTVEGTNKQELDRKVEYYGEDSDYVRWSVRGEFPRASANAFIDADTVQSCRKYLAQEYESLPKVLGVDVARFGDDKTVLVLRQGRKATCLGKFRGKNASEVASFVIDAIQEHEPGAVVLDADGVGAPVCDHLRFQGYGRLLVDFHGGRPANRPERYYNRRTEVWALLREAMLADFDIPDDPELADELCGPLFGFNPKQQLQLEKKDDMKSRGLHSPDMADALAMTFAVTLHAPYKPVRSREPRFIELGRNSAELAWMR